MIRRPGPLEITVKMQNFFHGHALLYILEFQHSNWDEAPNWV
jgi:hypothetical protein